MAHEGNLAARYASLESVLEWLVGLGRRRQVIAPRRGDDGGVRFEPVDPPAPDALREALGPLPQSLLPPGKVFTPADDLLFTWAPADDGGFRVEPHLDRTPRLLAGVRPCDLVGIALMDRVQSEGHADPHYLARRGATAIVGYACPEPCGDRCACAALGTLDRHDAADVVLAPVDGGLLAEARTDLGRELLADLDGEALDAGALADAWARHRAARPDPFGRTLPGGPAELARATAAAWSDPVWRRHTEACLACGTCNLVCPTCYCFDTRDEVDVAHPGCGSRCRSWDGCMLPGFAAVAGGHDFRRDLAARQRHRVHRKFSYLPAAHADLDAAFCVGCGRCATQCTAGIDIFDIARDLLGDPAGAEAPA